MYTEKVSFVISVCVTVEAPDFDIIFRKKFFDVFADVSAEAVGIETVIRVGFTGNANGFVVVADDDDFLGH